MRFVLIVFVQIVAILFVLAGVACGQSSNRFQLKDIFDLEYASDPQISPVGKHVVYVRNSFDIMTDRRRSRLWIVDIEGKDHRALTHGENDESTPRWSPDGKRLAYIRSDKKNRVLMCRWMDTGQRGRLARLTSAPADLVWSPDGKRIAFSMFVANKPKPYIKLPKAPKGAKWADPPKIITDAYFRHDGKGYLKNGFFHLFVLPSEGGTPRQITSGPYHHKDSPSWTPDGKHLVFSANRNKDWQYQPKESEIYEVSLPSGAIRQLTRRVGPDIDPVVSPDGKRIAYLGFDDRKQGYQVNRIYVMSRDGKPEKISPAKFDRTMRNLIWNNNRGGGTGLYFLTDSYGQTRNGYYELGFKQSPVGIRTGSHFIGGTTIGRPYTSGSLSVAKNGTFAYTYCTPEHPADVKAVGIEIGIPSNRRLTRLNDDLFAHKQLGKLEEIWFPSSHDKRKIQGWILKPPGFDPKKKYPLILEIHGGPFANYGPRFSAEMQLYAAAGYVVFYCNPRGSTSYGEEFGNLIHHNYPSHDYDDLMSGVDAVIKKGYIDEKNLFVTGGSGGGVLTAWIIGKTGRFRAAVVGKPVIDWFSFVLTADISVFFNQYWFPGPPWQRREHYYKRSPISLVGNVTTPAMIITGEEDYRTPMSQSEEYYQALKLRKVETVLVRVPGASHNIAARPSQLIAKVACVLKWFGDHRK